MNALHGTNGSVERNLDPTAVDTGILFLEALLNDEQLLRELDLIVDALDSHVEVAEGVLVASRELDDAITVLAKAGDEPFEFDGTGHSRTLSGVTR